MKKFLSILMAMLLVVAMAIPTFAESKDYDTAESLGIPSPNSVWIDKTTYPVGVVILRGDLYYLNLFKNVPYIPSKNDSLKASGGYQQYILSDGFWEFQMTSDNDLTVPADYRLIWTSHDIYDEEGYLIYHNDPAFFPRSLSEVIQETTTETLRAETLPAVAGTMTTLTLCGVGLMALLVVLSLFGKRSLISRG